MKLLRKLVVVGSLLAMVATPNLARAHEANNCEGAGYEQSSSPNYGQIATFGGFTAALFAIYLLWEFDETKVIHGHG